ncbi:hypothetical protein GCM10009555_086560 [Acrocarpospora macrocephala]|uniref:Uncharacterized protein n=1 Tax=Acrocarpospora macrocephala TaxID=150177 RepID=A0A5M3WKI0_9ACTN|nr:hypothetical protein [Acrocarpospora macrocephala]GES08910.1 hypothetical protein Amac_025060 [Acrocarpospora macrocephala]
MAAEPVCLPEPRAERFRKAYANVGNGTIALHSRANNMYVAAEPAGAQPRIANRTAIGPWERFDLGGS